MTLLQNPTDSRMFSMHMCALDSKTCMVGKLSTFKWGCEWKLATWVHPSSHPMFSREAPDDPEQDHRFTLKHYVSTFAFWNCLTSRHMEYWNRQQTSFKLKLTEHSYTSTFRQLFMFLFTRIYMFCLIKLNQYVLHNIQCFLQKLESILLECKHSFLQLTAQILINI